MTQEHWKAVTTCWELWRRFSGGATRQHKAGIGCTHSGAFAFWHWLPSALHWADGVYALQDQAMVCQERQADTTEPATRSTTLYSVSQLKLLWGPAAPANASDFWLHHAVCIPQSPWDAIRNSNRAYIDFLLWQVSHGNLVGCSPFASTRIHIHCLHHQETLSSWTYLMFMYVNLYCLLFRHRLIGMQTQNENKKDGPVDSNSGTIILA